VTTSEKDYSAEVIEHRWLSKKAFEIKMIRDATLLVDELFEGSNIYTETFY
jgi:hypothetical protein